MKWNGKTLLLWLILDLKIIRFHEWDQSFRSNDSSRWINHKMEHMNEKTSIWKWYFVFELNQRSNSIIILFRYVNDWSFIFLYLNHELSREKRNIPLVGRNCGSSNRIERSMWQYYAMQLFFFFNISGQIACCRDTDYIFISILFPIYIAFVKHSLVKQRGCR